MDMLLFSTLLCFYTSVLTVSSVFSAPQLIVHKNNGIFVNYGRSVYLRPERDLVFIHDQGHCQVSVLKENPKNFQMGTLYPSTFPCDFRENQVKYQHFGALSILQDIMKLQVRLDTGTETVVHPFTIKVTVLFSKPLEVLNKVQDIVVDELGGLSEPINDKVLGFNFNKANQNCHVRLFDSRHGPPFYGRVVNVTAVTSKPGDLHMDCLEFLDGSLRYLHKQRQSSNRDYLPLVVEVTPKGSEKVDHMEFIQVPVRIKRAPENERPSQSFDAVFSIQVDQSVITAITPEVLAVQDKETDSDLIILNVTRPFKSDEGILINTDNPNQPVTTFYQKDIKDYKIAFKPSGKVSKSAKVHQIWFQAIDSEGARSIPFYLFVIIKVMNTNAPKINKNLGLTMFEGQSRALTSEVLEVKKIDNRKNVKVSIVAGLKHGRLEKFGQPIKAFDLISIDQGTIRYLHDDSDTYSDNMIFRLTDRNHQVDVLFTVTVIPKDDEPPVLKHNTGCNLDEGGVTKLDQFRLSAVDVDSDDTKLIYQVITPPNAGGLCYRQTKKPSKNEVGWTKSGEMYEKNVTEFSQTDIYLGRVYYRHFGDEVFSDRFTFRLADTNDIPNKSGLKTFVVSVKRVDDLKPTLVVGCPRQMRAMETVISKFNKKVLQYTDKDTENDKLVYKITKKPYFTDNPNLKKDAGKLVLVDNENVEVSRFTQYQVNHFKIAYKPPAKEIGRQKREVKFEYSVEDPAGNSVESQEFKIDLEPINNKPPVAIINVLRVDERKRTILSNAVFDVRDEDNAPEEISLGIKTPPRHGTLFRAKKRLVSGDVFPLLDVYSNNIVYAHDGSETVADSIELLVNDGVHSEAVSVPIVIRPIDDERPKVKTLASNLNVLERGIVTITRDVISGTDEDTSDEKLIFLIVNGPQYGVVEKAGVATNMFTQKDMAEGIVVYKHTSGEIGLSKKHDLLNLTLSDMSDDWLVGGNRYNGILLNITVLPVDSEPPEVTIGDPVNVRESLKVRLTKANVKITDVDSKVTTLGCEITKQPEFGFVEVVSPAEGSEKKRLGLPAQKILNKDLIEKQVNYVQSRHENIEPSLDQFAVVCSDGNNTSPETVVNVLIAPTNDEKPVPLIRDFVVLENDFLPINIAMLNAIDGDLPEDDIEFFIVTPPKHGEILLQKMTSSLVPIMQFSKAILLSDETTILYQHDGTETKADKFKLVVSDGVHNVSAVIPVAVVPVDDETPRMAVNTGLKVDRGEVKTLTERNVKATDLDSKDDNLMYFVMSVAKLGVLQKKMNSNNYHNFSKGENFTQKDINDRKIVYRHFIDTKGERDVIRFDVSDSFNRLINQLFYVMIEPEDNIYPQVINKGVTLKEGDQITLTTDILSASDINSQDEKLTFFVTKVPVKGHLENTDHPGIPITSFTQLQLAGNKVIYVHKSKDEIKVDSFEFEVSDGVNKVYRTFRVTLSDVDNKKPVLHLSPISVYENKDAIITPFEIRADDKDTKPENVVFTVTQFPLHGQLIKDGVSLANSFTQKDINDNRISYRHDGTETKSDTFSVTVADGTHLDFYVFPETSKAKKTPQIVDINIQPVDNKLPVLEKNTGASALVKFKDNSLGFQFSKETLQARDRDSDTKKLLFIVTTSPKHGRIVNVSAKNFVVKNFTQCDIDFGHIRYILNEGENSTSDSFVFKLVDGGKNVLSSQLFYLNWAWITFSQADYNVTESDEYLVVSLNRRGYLGETSFASVKVINGTAKEHEDFAQKRSNQVQFSPGQAKATLKIRIIDDLKYEKSEAFVLKLVDGIHAVVGDPENSTVTILNAEDEPRIIIQSPEYIVQESIGVFRVPLKRLGDKTKFVRIVCTTASGTARGTDDSTVTSYRDYISRSIDNAENIITFDKDETLKYCPVTIIDDSLYEENESFKVVLHPYLDAAVGPNYASTEIIILADGKDEPKFNLDKSYYLVDESAGFLNIRVKRSGPDLSVDSSVLFATRQLFPVSARAERDYVPQVRNLQFISGVSEMLVKVSILDDIARPRIEGKENFTVVLRSPLNAGLGSVAKATITIDDTISDLPTIYFEKSEYKVRENASFVTTILKRRGDIRHETYVRCYTRQDTALAGKDFVERRDTNDSFITFKPRVKKQECKAYIINDTVQEPEEKFRLVVGSAFSPSAGGARIGGRNSTWIKIQDNDQSTILFKQTKYYIREPSAKEEVKVLEIPVARTGDKSKESVVTVFTQDGSAKAGIHYEPQAKVLTFGVNVTEHLLKIRIFHETEKSLRRAFTLHLKPDSNRIAELGLKKTIVYIEEVERRTGVTFPLKPIVVSLQDYDDAANARQRPIQGYPVICVTACNPKYPRFALTSSICNSERIDNRRTRYRWQVAAPDSQDGVTSQFVNVDSNTFFTTTRRITLDSIYFGPGSRVRCIAQAIEEDGGVGVESYSQDAIIDPKEGLCMPRRASDIGAETFSAQVKYTGTKDKKHPNLVRVRILVPHFDGLLPAISTKQLSNFELTLSPDASRVAQHSCSNLLDVHEIVTRHSFLTNDIIDPNGIGGNQPYQYDSQLRGNNTLRFYRHLNLDACLWTFESYYDMTELIQKCGGKITTDGQVKNSVQSHLSVKVPLYVSYIYHSPTGEGGWMHFDHRSSLRLTFVYDTAVLWKDGVGPPVTSPLKGNLYPTSIRIRDSDRKLVVNFRTKARFRGQFILKAESSSEESMVVSPDQPSLTMRLRLIRSDPTYAEPEQMWQFVSDFAVRDYSGQYIIKLIPCTVTEDIEYELPLECTPRDAITFQLPIRFQQTSEPVEAKFSLNTRFYLLNREDQWLSSKFAESDATDVAFNKGSTIFGRVMIDTAQSLGSAYHVVIEKVFLCSGLDGYVPKFDPANNEYGCLADSTNLLYRFKILDRLAPNTITTQFDNVPFKALLAVDDKTAEDLVKVAGADGFKLDSAPLFKVSGGRNWFLHSIYTVRSEAQKNRGVGKRSLDYINTDKLMNSLAAVPHDHQRVRRDTRDIRSIGVSKGTNIQMIRLAYDAEEYVKEEDEVPSGLLPKEKGSKGDSPASEAKSKTLIAVIVVVVVIVLIVIVIAAVIVSKRTQASNVKRTASAVSVGDQEGTEI